jgi:tRNA (cmo5U34)-methyltransferase
MTHSTAQTFDAHAPDYDALRRRLVPNYDAFYGAAIAALRLIPRAPRRVLDLGAGTGLLSRHVAAAFPDAELTLVDGAGAMLDQARAAMGDRHTYVQADLRDPLPEGPWCAVVSALAIHHLEDADKQTLLRRAHDVLAPRGVFVNAEQVAGPTPLLDEHYAGWHEHASEALGATADEWAGARQRMRHDRCASVGDQLAWIRAAGFGDADCLFKDHRFAVLVGRRPG